MSHLKFICNHYNKHTDLYEYWSGGKEGGYHFGIVNNWKDIFSNSKMIKNASDLVLESLGLDLNKTIRVLDAGCGAGHVSRLLAGRLTHNKYEIYGVDVSTKQIKKGKELNNKKKNKKIFLIKESFEELSFGDDFFDAIFFVESICHGEGPRKEKALKESLRVLKPGGKIVIHDGFLLTDKIKRGVITKQINRILCNSWGVVEWPREKLFLEEMQKIGFVNIKKRNLSWKISFSVLNALFIKFPEIIYRYIRKQLEFYDVKYILTVGILAPLLGIHPCFRYESIIATKGLPKE